MNKEKIVVDYLPLIRKIAASYNRCGVPQEDLEQEGMIGLLEAADKFEDDKGAKFSTYATYWIKKYVLAAVEREAKTSLYSSELNEAVVKDEKATELPPSTKIELPEGMPLDEKTVLTLLFEKELTLKEISQQMKISRERVRQLKEKGLRRLRAQKQ